MRKYYTRPCNFYYGNYARMLIKKKKAFSLAGSPNIAFDQVEIFQRRKKGIVASNFYSINEVKSLSKEKKTIITTDISKITSRRKRILGLRFDNPVKRIKNRDTLDKIIADIFVKFDQNYLVKKLRESKIACGVLNEIEDLELHSQLRKIVCKVNDKKIDVIAPPAIFIGQLDSVSVIPKLGEHSKSIRKEFNDK